MNTRAEAREYLVTLLDAFTPPTGSPPATALIATWKQDHRSAWWMDSQKFSPQAGAWGLRLPTEAAVGQERTQAVTELLFDVIVPIQLSPAEERLDEDLLVDQFADALRTHTFESREVGQSPVFVSTTIQPRADGWVYVIQRGKLHILFEG
jgi:hypothetical protein